MSNFSPELVAVLEALQKIDNQADLNVIAERWKSQMNFVGRLAGRGIVKGDTIQWEYGGLVKTGKVVKVNPKTVEVANVGANPFGATITKIYKSMITGKVAA
jgi:hypothetical protein